MLLLSLVAVNLGKTGLAWSTLSRLGELWKAAVSKISNPGLVGQLGLSQFFWIWYPNADMDCLSLGTRGRCAADHCGGDARNHPVRTKPGRSSR